MTHVKAVLAALEQAIRPADNQFLESLTEDTIRFREIERWWGLATGAQPWSAVAGIRDALAHHRLDEADPALLHYASTTEAVEIVEVVRAAI